MSSPEYADRADVELVPGYMRAYRFWSLFGGMLSDEALTDHPLLLYSLFGQGLYWDRGVNTARCVGYMKSVVPTRWAFTEEQFGRQCKRTPEPDCSCGFYGTHHGLPSEYSDYPIGGSFKVFGRVILGTYGLRAEKVEVEALCLNYRLLQGKSHYNRAHELADRYGVPLFLDERKLLKAFPPVDVSPLLGTATPPNYYYYYSL